MTPLKLREIIKNSIDSCKESQKINFNTNKGLSGSIATEKGRCKDYYLKGKIQAYTYVLELLEKE